MSNFNFYSYERLGKILLYMIVDVLMLIFSFLVAIWLWYEVGLPGSSQNAIPHEAWIWLKYIISAGSVISVSVFSIFHMYNNLWKYASIDEIFKIFISTTIIFVLIYLFDAKFVSTKNILVTAKRVLFVAWTFYTITFTFSRFGYRMVKRFFILIGHIITRRSGLKRVMVIGAGFSGYGVVRGMLHNKTRDKLPIIIVDNDISKSNTVILGIRVICGFNRIEEFVEKYQIEEIIIAKPDAQRDELKQIMDECTKTECTLKIIPPISDVNDTKKQITSFRDVNVSDLLYREEVKLDIKNISDYLTSRTILVTGGGGSIGSELCRQIAKFDPKLLIIFDIYENNAFSLLNELSTKYDKKLNIIVRIGSIRDEKRVSEIFQEFNPNVVFHAAAHKHVTLMEESPGEAVKNNVFGTLNVAKCADAFNTEKFVLLSSDKAVNPTNVMGATKRITELIIQHLADKSKTKFMAVRFGNVLGSNGSVIPIFKQQIEDGGPVTVTHQDIVRYFMTIPEACQLVLQAAGLGQTGRIFVLDMGSPVKIADLAKNLIKLSGLRPDKDIKIVYTGLRPGEKLFEELIMEEEKDNMQVSCHKKIFVAKPIQINSEIFEKQLENLKKFCSENPNQVVPALKQIVPNYKDADEYITNVHR